MTAVSVIGRAAQDSKTVELPEEIFAAKVNVPLIHQVVVAQRIETRPYRRAPKAKRLGSVPLGSQSQIHERMPVKPVSALYEPINVYKPVAPSVGIADRPFDHVTLLGMKMPWPFTTRMTVVQLASGELFLHSPIAFDAALAAHLQSLGRVRHLVSPNRGHYAHIGEWTRAFPDAVASASPGVRERARSQGVDAQFQRDLEAQRRRRIGATRSTRRSFVAPSWTKSCFFTASPRL